MRSSKHILPASCLISLLATPCVFAAPAITGATGDTTQGATVTLNGSAFGTKSVARPLVFDNFETGTSGASITGKAPTVAGIGSSWTWGDHSSSTELPVYTSSNQRTGSTRSSLQHVAGGTYNNSLEIVYDRPNSGDEVYFTYWYYHDKISTAHSRNHKPWVAYGPDAGMFPEAYIGWGNPDFGDGSLRTSFQDSPMPSTSTIWGNSAANMINIPGKWIRVEQYLKQSSPNGSDGAIETILHLNGSIVSVHSRTQIITRTRSYGWRQFHFGSYFSTRESDTSSLPAEANFQIDDMYFDNTRARIEIGDAATWSGCTHREIQVPVAWSNSSVQFNLNRGTFANGTTVYIYVVDALGQPNSQGYPMVVGGAAAESTSSPLPPSNFNVQAL